MKNLLCLRKPVQTREVFKEIETAYHIQVPECVQQFLMENGGGFLEESSVNVGDYCYNVYVFFNVDPDSFSNVFTLMNCMEQPGNEMMYVPFAENGFGNPYCLKFDGRMVIGIVYIDHDCDDEEIPICRTFDEFLKLTGCL